jgi:hypothetical protein
MSDCPKRIPMPSMRHPLTEPDERAVVRREPGGGDQLADWQTAQAGQDLRVEDLRSRLPTLPFAHRSLVGGVLAPADQRRGRRARGRAVRRVAAPTPRWLSPARPARAPGTAALDSQGRTGAGRLLAERRSRGMCSAGLRSRRAAGAVCARARAHPTPPGGEHVSAASGSARGSWRALQSCWRSTRPPALCGSATPRTCGPAARRVWA